MKQRIITILLIFVLAITVSASSLVSADEIEYISYDEYKADYYIDYASYEYYMSSDFVMPYRTVVVRNRESAWYQGLITAWQIVAFQASDATEITKRKLGFYEAFLFDILYTGYESQDIGELVNKMVDSLQISTMENLTSFGRQFNLDHLKKNMKDMSEEDLKFFSENLSSCSELKRVFEAIGSVADVIEYATTGQELIFKLCKVETISRLTGEYAEILNTVAHNTNDQTLKLACTEFASMCSKKLTKEDVISYMVSDVALTEMADEMIEKGWDFLLNKLTGGYGMIIDAGKGIGKWTSGILFSTDKEIETFYEMSALYDFENELRQVVKFYKEQYLNNKTQENAKLFNASFELLLKTLELGCNISVKYAELTNETGAMNLFVSYLTGKYQEFLKYRESLERIASYIKMTREFANSGLYNAYLEVYPDVVVEIGLEAVPMPDNVESIEPILLELKEDILKTSDVFITEDFTLTEDFETFGDLYVQGGTLWLNGHNLTVAGNVYLESGTIRCSDGTLEIGYNLEASGGTLYLNGGTVTVGGDVIFANVDNYGDYTASSSNLCMDNANDSIRIGGTLITYFENVGYYNGAMNCSAGTMYLEGDWENYGRYIYGGESFELVLTSETDQKIYDPKNAGIFIQTITVENTEHRNMIIEGKLVVGVLSENVKIKAINNPSLEFDMTKGTLDIEGDCTLSIGTKAGGNVTVIGNLIGNNICLNGSGKILKVTGDYQQAEGTLYPKGGSIEIGGNAIFAYIDNYGDYTSTASKLCMDNASDSIHIGGTLVTYFENVGYYNGAMNCSAGTIYLEGDWKNYGRYIYGGESFELVLTSETDQKIYDPKNAGIFIQTITVENTEHRNMIIEGKLVVGVLSENVKIKAINNPSLEFDMTKGTLDIEGDCTLSIGTKAGGNVTVIGNLIGNNICLNGSGKILKVTGDYQQAEGTLYPKGGSIEIGGNAIFAYIDNYGDYTSTASKLCMDNASDSIHIGGTLVTYFENVGYYNGAMNCSAGTMYLEGDWENYGRYIYNTDTFEVILINEQDQTINNESTDVMHIPTLIIWNGTSRMVQLLGTIEIGEKRVIEGSGGKETYSITYELDGGAVVGNPSSYFSDTTTFVLMHPVKEGYTFFGWTGSNGTIPQKIVTIEQGSIGNLTFIANWKPENYKVSYHLIHGDINSETPIYVVPEEIHLKEFNEQWFQFDLLEQK